MDAKTLREKLAGAELVLQDEKAVAQFRFHATDDGVGATLGTRGGPVCGPLLHYLVTDDAEVEISDHSSVVFTWEQIELSDGIMTVKCGSRVKRFTFTPAKKRERYLP
jgi:hypothetical protein